MEKKDVSRNPKNDKAGFCSDFYLFMYVIQHCFICRPSDFTVSEDAGIEPRTVMSLALTARHSNPQSTYFTERGQSYLSSSKILTLHPPLRPASVYPPPLLRGEDRLAGRRGGCGFNILEDERNRIALLQ
jgi:hypothetical protein